MPLYEYACAECGHQLEARQKMSDPPLKICPKCGDESLERLVSRSSFALKGSGWYADGYGATGGKDTKVADAKPGKTTDAKVAETKTADAKPESKPAETVAKPDAPKPKDSGD
jgi:putative FmdB family regulatory protein